MRSIITFAGTCFGVLRAWKEAKEYEPADIELWSWLVCPAPIQFDARNRPCNDFLSLYLATAFTYHTSVRAACEGFLLPKKKQTTKTIRRKKKKKKRNIYVDVVGYMEE